MNARKRELIDALVLIAICLLLFNFCFSHATLPPNFFHILSYDASSRDYLLTYLGYLEAVEQAENTVFSPLWQTCKQTIAYLHTHQTWIIIGIHSLQKTLKLCAVKPEQ